MGDNFPGPLRECDQDIERAAAERYRLVSLLEQPLGRKQAEGAKRKHVLELRIAVIIHTRRPRMRRAIFPITAASNVFASMASSCKRGTCIGLRRDI